MSKFDGLSEWTKESEKPKYFLRVVNNGLCIVDENGNTNSCCLCYISSNGELSLPVGVNKEIAQEVGIQLDESGCIQLEKKGTL